VEFSNCGAIRPVLTRSIGTSETESGSDVLIAFFGGAAGMIGLTRKQPTTLIPGVAVATARMPPLCTARYGLATGQASFFFGAFFLFTIDSVFIALATLGITRVLRALHGCARRRRPESGGTRQQH
jgi:uncharacterized membrane protein